MALDCTTMYLYLGQDGNNWDDDAEDQVEANEDLVLRAVVRLCVVNVEKHHSSDSQCIVEDGKRQETWRLHGCTFIWMASNHKFDYVWLTWTISQICLIYSKYYIKYIINHLVNMKHDMARNISSKWMLYLQTSICCHHFQHFLPTPCSRSGQSRWEEWVGLEWRWRTPLLRSKTTLWNEKETQLIVYLNC